jgi:hypothetical protein
MVGGTIRGRQSYVFEQHGKPLGYGEVYQQQAHWHLRLSLRPEVWGTTYERKVLQMLTSALASEPGAVIALHVPSVAHFEALGTGETSLASELGFTAQHAARMVMVKGVARAHPLEGVPETGEED